MGENPIPNRYPPQLPLRRNQTFLTGVEACDKMCEWTGLLSNLDTDPRVIYRPFIPEFNVSSTVASDLSQIPSANLAGLVYSNLPDAWLTKVTLTILLDTPPAPAAFDSSTAFFKAAASALAGPYVIDFVDGTTDSYVYQRAYANAALPGLVYSPINYQPRNALLLWYGLDDLIAQTQFSSKSMFQDRDVLQFEMDMPQGGIKVQPGDTIRYVSGGPLDAYVRNFYVSCTFRKRFVLEEIAYDRAGYTSVAVAPKTDELDTDMGNE